MKKTVNRRSFFKKAGLGGLGLGLVLNSTIEEQIEHVTSGVNRFSSPSDLKITDMRIAQVGNIPIVKIYTNQGVHGLGDVRDGADKRYALMLKSRILGENPCNVEKIFKIIKQFGGHGRLGGGVSGSCRDIEQGKAGKVNPTAPTRPPTSGRLGLSRRAVASQ